MSGARALLAPAPERRGEHPMDVVERAAGANDWTFEREDEDEISLVVEGRHARYHCTFTWLDDLEALHLACAFDLKVPERRRAEVRALLALANERQWVGHFDHWGTEDAVMFRHGLPLAGGAASPGQCEALLRLATEACERYHAAFHFVVWGGLDAAGALETALVETAGEA